MKKMSDRDIPIGVRFIQKCVGVCCPRTRFNRDTCYRVSILLLTYLSYTCYHMTRKPISVVKNVLYQNCSSLVKPDDVALNSTTWCDWAPFDREDAPSLLGTLDSAFLFAYAIAMFISGFVAERVNLRYFLSLGMLFSGIASYLFGIAKTYNIHSLTYFIIIQAIGGVVQTTGWPSVVTIVGNWCGKAKRGIIYGIWNSHTCVGNIVGTLIAAAFVEDDWSLSFIYPGLIMGVMGFVIFLFLVVSPNDVGCDERNASPKGYKKLRNPTNYGSSDESGSSNNDIEILIGEQEVQQRRYSERTPILPAQAPPPPHSDQAIGLLKACQIPGVLDFAFCLFFAKLVSYTYLYWLPIYIKNTSPALSSSGAADISTLFDIGGIFGAILAGMISDYSGMSATTCLGMLFIAVPIMFIYESIGSASFGINIILLFFVGFFVNGPYALITTSVSAELGTHSSLEGNAKALATVTAIIDGTGSIGAAVGPLLAGFVSSYNWENVFYILMCSDFFAMLFLIRLVKQECSRLRLNHNE